jgi:7-carboxy-7-deazaguanine synthase
MAANTSTRTIETSRRPARPAGGPTLRVAEIFASVQGEGFLTGTPSVFVRTSGCNLRCGYCDTRYASWLPEGEMLSIEQIAARVFDLRRDHVVLTGGEPMLLESLVPLAALLRRSGRHITIETAGTVDRPVACDLMSISPKLSNSDPPGDTAGGWHIRHRSRRCVPEVIRRLVRDYEYQVKFVVDSPASCEELQRYLEQFPEIRRDRALLMPEGTDATVLAERASWLEPFCRDRGLHYCPRRHVEWFGSRRGT